MLRQGLWRTTATAIRGLATEVAGGTRKLRLSFVSPYQTILKDATVEQVNLTTTDGDMGVLGGHVPALLQLRPGLIEVFEGPASSPSTVKKSYYVSGGFAMVNPDGGMEISAMEAVPTEQLDPKVVADGLAEATRRAATAPANDLEKAEVQIHQDLYQSMHNAILKTAPK